MGREILPFAPKFTRMLETRNVGPAPLRGGPRPVASGWVRARVPGAPRDAAFLGAMIDAYWPPLFSVETEPRVVGTIAYMLDIAGSCEGLDPEAPLFHRSFTVSEREGYAVEVRELWGEDGRFLAINQQTIAIIR
jgi:hypothetical protein